MLNTLNYSYHYLKELDEKYRDPRTEKFMFLDNPCKILTISALYYAFVMHIGPKWMANRKPFDLKYLLLFYNSLQVVLNSHISVLAAYNIWVHQPYDNLLCMLPIKHGWKGMLELEMCNYYCVLKLLDFLDTVFFVLRKRQRQVTFLHVYHHLAVANFTSIFVAYVPGGHGAALGVINSFVHVIMYSYYFWTVLRPGIKDSLWWKRYITLIQMAQFVILFLHNAYPLAVGNCQFPKWALAFACFQYAIMLVLFGNFYIHTYGLNSKTIKPLQNGAVPSTAVANGKTVKGYGERAKEVTKVE